MLLANRRAALVESLRNLPPHMLRRVEESKARGMEHRRRPDMLWHLLLQSASTQGNSRGWQGLFGNPELLASVSFNALSRQSAAGREAAILNALRVAKVRMPVQKTPWLTANFDRIQQMGGVEAATKHMLALQGREAKYKFITSFHGIGPKYGRNLWMDQADTDFLNSIAVDERVKKVAAALALPSRRYTDVEEFFVSVARDSNLTPWEVDRLLYNFTDYFLSVIEAAT